VSKNRIFFLTQGINTTVHFPQFDFKEKELAIVFVGLYENSRAEVILKLINAGFKVYIAGIGWSKFLNLYRCDNLNFIGSNLNDFEYSKALSKCIFALGLLQKKFPELHTTRTFEIPACGTCLITERNHEIDSFFNDDECIKYTNCITLTRVVTNECIRKTSCITLTGVVTNECVTSTSCITKTR
jgi:hypothetical protein